MIKNLLFLSSLVIFSNCLFAQQDSIKIEKAVLLLYDSWEIAQEVTQIQYY